MSDPGPNSLAEIIAGSDRLQALEQAREARSTWTKSARNWLPAELADHLVAATTDAAGHLILAFDSAAWASRARYAERDIISAANNPGIKAVKVRVHPRGGLPSSRGASSNE